jgi:xanthine dehydrogenase accessory factor
VTAGVAPLADRGRCDALEGIAARLLAEALPVMLVEIAEARGSTPRGDGTRMLVPARDVYGTIGGGHLEHEAIGIARAALAAGAPDAFVRRFALGPSLGQCCGGSLALRFERLSRRHLQSWPARPRRFVLQLHGAGHVARALVRALEPLACLVDWVDERADEFAVARRLRGDAPWPAHIGIECTDSPQVEVARAPPGAMFLVMTHSHALDFAICEAVLRRGDFAFLGLIGSATKRARFARRLRERGFDETTVARLTCPIGVRGITGKDPEVIALSTAAQLLQLSAPPAASPIPP